MSRPRGPKRVDRPEDREEIVALAMDVWRRTIDLNMRVPFGAPHYWSLSDVTLALFKLLEALDAAPCEPHSTSDAAPSRERGDG